ncbi:twin-arginine translocation signal domain-containing protein [Desulfosporosinus sp. BICA1-9]|uniref:twin-arginine translocation signal domain-containing protein n=1 Tax=Desulfosporosinus sp. BICA1-9 TaxID=1531958 RepID=UPI000A3FBBBA
MQISRREFLKWSVAAAVALGIEVSLGSVSNVLAAETDPPIIWLKDQGAQVVQYRR